MTYQGIILRQTKALNNRRILLLFSDEHGKISAGTSINEKTKGKSALALRPFTLSRFEITENKGYLNIRDAETIKSYYKIGEDLDKFANASYVMEFTGKLLPEGIPAPKFFSLLTEYLEVIERKKSGFATLTLAYIIKSLEYTGVGPQIKGCLSCGEGNKPAFFDVENAGFICENCRSKSAGGYQRNSMVNSQVDIGANSQSNFGEKRGESVDFYGGGKLLYKLNFDIVNILNFLIENSLRRVENLELDPAVTKELWKIIKEYTAYHLDIGNIKSESLLDI